MNTPGPWTIQPIGDETEANILGAGRELIATVSDNDAHLIAAAPELLEALELAEATIERLQRHAPGTALGTLDVMRTAIAKAKGEK